MTESDTVGSNVDWFLKPDLLSYPKFGASVGKLHLNSIRGEAETDESTTVR